MYIYAMIPQDLRSFPTRNGSSVGLDSSRVYRLCSRAITHLKANPFQCSSFPGFETSSLVVCYLLLASHCCQWLEQPASHLSPSVAALATMESHSVMKAAFCKRPLSS